MKKDRKDKAAKVNKGAGGFSLVDAQNMLAIARSAVIPDMAQAEARSQLFQRYSVFVADTLMPKPAAPAAEGSAAKK